MHEADNKCMKYTGKKFLSYGINWNTYTWKSIILELILNKRDEREWIKFMCQERAQ